MMDAVFAALAAALWGLMVVLVRGLRKLEQPHKARS